MRHAAAHAVPHAVVLALAVALTGCSSSDDDDTAGLADSVDAADDAGASPDPAAEGYVIGGASCTSEGTATTGDGDTAPIAIPGEVEGDDAEEAGPAPDDANGIASDGDDGAGPCAASPDALDPSAARPSNGTGRLAFDGTEATLSGAILSVDDVQNVAASEEFRLLLHDGQTRIARSEDVAANGDRTSGTAYGVYDAIVALSVGLLPGDAGDGPATRTYDVMADARDLEGPGTEGVGIAAEPLLFVDLDGNGEIGLAEFFEPTAGQLVWAGTAEAPSLSFTFTLEDGRSIEGNWEGGLELVE